MYEAIINDKHKIQSKTLRGLKMQGSKIVNDIWQPIHTMKVTTPDGQKLEYAKYHEIYPSNKMIVGEWQ